MAAADELVVLALLRVLAVGGVVLIHQVATELLLPFHGERRVTQLAAEEAGRRPHLHLILGDLSRLLLLLFLLLWPPLSTNFLPCYGFGFRN